MRSVTRAFHGVKGRAEKSAAFLEGHFTVAGDALHMRRLAQDVDATIQFSMALRICAIAAA